MCFFVNVDKIILKFFLADLAIIGMRRGNLNFGRREGGLEGIGLLNTTLNLFFELAFLKGKIFLVVLLN